MSIIDRTLNNKLNLIYHNLINDINQLEQHKVIPMFNMWIKHKYTEYYKDYDKVCEEALIASLVTHNYPMGYLSGIISALFTAYAINNINPFKIDEISNKIQKLLSLPPVEQKKIFITFGGPTSNFHNSVKRICNEAKNLEFFDTICGFTDIDLKNDKIYSNAIRLR